MIDPKIVLLLRCPAAGTPLRATDEQLVESVNRAIHENRVRNRSGGLVQQPIEGGLVAENWLYPIRGGIPILIAEEAIEIRSTEQPRSP